MTRPTHHRDRADITRRRIERRETKRKEVRKSKRLQRDLRIRVARSQGIVFDPNLERVQIVMPSVLSLEDNFDEVAECLERMRLAGLDQRKPVMVHLSHVEQVEPAAALVLVAEMDRIRKHTSFFFVNGTYPQNIEVLKSLGDMGFFRVIHVKEPLPSSEPAEMRPVFFPFLSGTEVDAELADSFVQIIEKHIIPMSPKPRGCLVAAIKEAMQNTIDHAHPHEDPRSGGRRSRWWISSRFDVVAREVSIVFYDAGVGIPTTIGMERYQDIVSALRSITRLVFGTSPSDGELIAAATEKHRTRTGDERRGKGFFDMKRFISECQDGTLRVLSKRGRYHYIDRGTESYGNSERSLDGTVIEWRFRNEGALEME